MTDVKETITQVGATWLKGQPFNNVMAVLLLLAMTSLGWVAIFQVIPAERMAIQGMAEHMEQEQTKQIERVCDSFEKGLDRNRELLSGYHQELQNRTKDRIYENQIKAWREEWIRQNPGIAVPELPVKP